MFSKSCEYAFRAIIFLSSRNTSSPVVKIQEIAEAIQAPMHYTSKVLQSLSREGIVGSLKGPGGGFFVDGTHAKIPLLEIVRVIDGDKVFSGCAIGLIPCSEKNPCPLHERFKAVRDDLKKMLSACTIKELTDDLYSGKLKLKIA